MSNTGMSDLDLVAQAMGISSNTSRPTQQQRQANGQAQPTPPVPTDTAPPPTQIPVNPNLALDAETIEVLKEMDIDVSSMPSEILASLLPIINAIKISGDATDGEDDVEAMGDEFDFARISAQIDAANGAADELEGKLDQLLANLGVTEQELANSTGGKDVAKVKASKADVEAANDDK